MTRYAKLYNGEIEFAPKNYMGISNFNCSKELMEEQGYKPLIENDMPLDGLTYIPSYEEQKGSIIKKWKEVHPINTPKELTYAEKRAKEYPPIGDQLDMIYWDNVYKTNIWQETISAIKAKYPKPKQENIQKE